MKNARLHFNQVIWRGCKDPVVSIATHLVPRLGMARIENEVNEFGAITTIDRLLVKNMCEFWQRHSPGVNSTRNRPQYPTSPGVEKRVESRPPYTSTLQRLICRNHLG